MKKFLGILVLAVSIVFCNGGRVFAQWDFKGCSEYGMNPAYPKMLESSLWTFRSNAWDGYIDFLKEGRYWTHWGVGTWSITPDGKLHMANSYNDRTYVVEFLDSGYRYEGVSNKGLKISGRLICAKYEGPGPQVPEEVAKDIKGYYTSLLEREASEEELKESFRQYNQTFSLDTVKKIIMETPEYEEIAAARAAAAAAAAAQYGEGPISGY